MADLSHLDMTKAAAPMSFTPIPAGEYKAMLVHSEVKPTKDGTGQRLALRFVIMEGQYQNRLIFEGLNIVNKKSDTQAIALRQLQDLKEAVGLPNASRSEELHHKPLTIKLAIKDDQNVIRAYKSRSESNNQQAMNMLQDAFQPQPATAASGPVNPFTKR